MTARSDSRGWPIIYQNNTWIYTDNKLPVDDLRPCKKCGQQPTTDGYDACLGKIDHCISACCGHGCKKAFVINP